MSAAAMWLNGSVGCVAIAKRPSAGSRNNSDVCAAGYSMSDVSEKTGGAGATEQRSTERKRRAASWFPAAQRTDYCGAEPVPDLSVCIRHEAHSWALARQQSMYTHLGIRMHGLQDNMLRVQVGSAAPPSRTASSPTPRSLSEDASRLSCLLSAAAVVHNAPPW